MRRTAALRRAPLRTGSSTNTRRRRTTGPSAGALEQLLERAGYGCEICGSAIGDQRGRDWSIHHRIPRQMGGTRNPWVNLPPSLLVVCGSGTTGCHGVVESSRTAAHAAGWLLHRAADPCEVPVLLVVLGIRRWVLLTHGGNAIEVRRD